MEMTLRTIADFIGSANGEDVFVCGSGQSVSGFDWDRLAGNVTIALNGLIALDGFNPTYHFWCDGLVAVKWPVIATETICVCPDCNSTLPEIMTSQYKETVTYKQLLMNEKEIAASKGPFNDPRWPEPYGTMRFKDHDVSLTGDDIYCSHTVATGAIHFAAKLGAGRVFLLGCDAYGSRSALGGASESYYDGGHSAVDEHMPVDIGGGRIRASAHIWWDMEQTKAREYFERHGRYQGRFPGSGIYNLSKHSTLTAWQKVDQEVALADALHHQLVGAGR